MSTNKAGGGVFILVSDKLIGYESEELKVDGQCELVWAHIQISETSQLFVVSFIGHRTLMTQGISTK